MKTKIAGRSSHWQAICTGLNVDRKLLSMFKISQKTVRRFSLAEVLLMVAINQVDKRKVGSSPVKPAAKI